MQDTTYAMVTRWTECRTPSGRWSRVQHFKGESVYAPHNLSHFFSLHFPGERRQHTYFAQGYLPRRVTVSSPDGTQRSVYDLERDPARRRSMVANARISAMAECVVDATYLDTALFGLRTGRFIPVRSLPSICVNTRKRYSERIWEHKIKVVN